MTLTELRAKRAHKVKDMRAILDTAKAAGQDDLSKDEAELYALYKAEVEKIDANISRLEAQDSLEAEGQEVITARTRPGGTPIGEPAKKEFESFGEFIHSVRFKPDDQRLDHRAEQRMDDSSMGGVMVPKQFRNELLQVSPADAVVRPRATVIPAGSPPDSAITIPALSQSTGSNMYGGMVLNWIGEGGAKPETDVEFQEIELKPKEVAGYVTITDKLLRNWPAANGLLTNLFKKAIAGAEDQAFLTGSGLNKPLGFLNANNGSRILYDRATNSTIKYADIVGMFAKAKQGGKLTWIASPTTIPQLCTLEDSNGNAMWQPSVREGLPPTLMGIDVVFVPRVPALGTAGDLSLVDLNYYLIKDGSGIFVEASQHVYFTSNKTVIKAFWNVDGQPWLREPIVDEDAQTYSPFVVLDT